MSLEGHSRRFRLIRPAHGRSAAPPIPGIKLRPGDRRSVPEAAVSERQVYRDHRDPTAWLGWHPFGAAICSDAIGAFPSGILGFGVSPRGLVPSQSTQFRCVETPAAGWRDRAGLGWPPPRGLGLAPEVMNGIMYILSTGCQWRAIPKDLP